MEYRGKKLLQMYRLPFKKHFSQYSIRPSLPLFPFSYKFDDTDNDFAVIEFAEDIRFSDTVRPACLPANSSVRDGQLQTCKKEHFFSGKTCKRISSARPNKKLLYSYMSFLCHF